MESSLNDSGTGRNMLLELLRLFLKALLLVALS